MDWTSIDIHQQSLSRGQKYSFRNKSYHLSWRDVLTGWKQEEQFVSLFCQLLCTAPYKAYFFETPPLRRKDLDSPFEFVLIDCKTLSTVTAEKRFFAEHFQRSNGNSISFMNLSGDARLIVPRPVCSETNYAHIASFMRTASDAEKQSLWQQTASRYTESLDEQPRWLSTSGLGVYWLHIRIDKKPKYYTHHPYRTKHFLD